MSAVSVPDSPRLITTSRPAAMPEVAALMFVMPASIERSDTPVPLDVDGSAVGMVVDVFGASEAVDLACGGGDAVPDSGGGKDDTAGPGVGVGGGAGEGAGDGSATCGGGGKVAVAADDSVSMPAGAPFAEPSAGGAPPGTLGGVGGGLMEPELGDSSAMTFGL